MEGSFRVFLEQQCLLGWKQSAPLGANGLLHLELDLTFTENTGLGLQKDIQSSSIATVLPNLGAQILTEPSVSSCHGV